MAKTVPQAAGRAEEVWGMTTQVRSSRPMLWSVSTTCLTS